MSQAIILNDVAYYKHPVPSRAAGGHVIASSLRKNGYSCDVIDWFTMSKDIFSILKQRITQETKLIAISATFLAPKDSVGSNTLSEATGLGTFKVALDKQIDYEAIFEKNIYMWLETATATKEWFSSLKSLAPQATIIIGGARLSRVYSLIEKDSIYIDAYKDVDYFVLGEGDEIIVNIADKVFKNKPLKVNTKTIKGCTFIFASRFSGEIPQIYHTKRDGIVEKEWLPLEISRGCKFNCAFCNYEKNVFRKKPKHSLVEELTRNYELFGTQGYNLTADCLTDSREYVDIFCEALASLPFKIEFSSYARIDLFSKYEDMIDQLLEVGFKAGWFGIETFNHDAGKLIRKGLHPDKVKYLLELVKTKSNNYGGFWLLTYLIFGLPQETTKSLEETITWFTSQTFIDEVSVSILDFAEFSSSLSEITDYSDISSNPSKYGFKRLSFNPFYWEHDTLNITDAIEKKDKFRDLMAEHTFTRFGGGSTFEYPAIRSLGFSHEQTTLLLKNKFGVSKNLIKIDADKKKKASKALLSVSKDKLDTYYHAMLNLNNFLR
jgi:radical SAM superfamily enzyme YgiQ (UPF0313 family)